MQEILGNIFWGSVFTFAGCIIVAVFLLTKTREVGWKTFIIAMGAVLLQLSAYVAAISGIGWIVAGLVGK